MRRGRGALPADFDQLYHDVGEDLRRYLRQRVPQGAVADVSQDVWTSWLAAETVPADREGARRFLFRLAQRRVADWHRNRVPVTEELPAAPVVPGPDPEIVDAVLRKAGASPGSLVWRRVVDDWSLDELARYEGVPLGTIKSRLHRDTRDVGRRLHDWRYGPGYRPPVVRELLEGLVTPPVWTGLVDRLSAVDYAQRVLTVVGSDLSLTLIGIIRIRVRHPDLVYCQGGQFPMDAEIVNRRGRALRPTLHQTPAGQQWAYPVRSLDDERIVIRARLEPESPMARHILHAGRQALTVTLPIRVSPLLDDTLTLRLPATVTAPRFDPDPVFVHRDGAAIVAQWRGTATLPRYPNVTARWVTS